MAKKLRVKEYFVLLFFLVYMAVLVFATLFTHNYYTYGQSSNFILFSSIRLMLRSGNSFLIMKNIVGNLLLFMPLGLFLSWLLPFQRMLIGQVLIGFGVSLLIESCQFFFAERIFDIDDIFLNTIGALMGFFLFRLLHFLKRRCVIFYSK
ncbi:VanZ family protein [Sporolactobacillus sp. CPB3-1]|uniref:VanZ family protein n=1 Tax=Sporolactobacillus mangiferae TaxID=2940498 RepID=A0ABT0MCJ3_9BACL|nr:VanZ family protein [Sporolactobacillus mangiferae]MCL1632050.1 VanZ family protein [Sporolactobacillus mangiferae]